MPLPASPVVLPEETARFLQSGLSIILASRNPHLQPSVARALACRVSGDGSTVELFAASTKLGPLLDDLRAGAPIAVAFTLPSSHRTLQIKAPSAEIGAVSAADRDFVAVAQSRFADDVERVMDSPQRQLLRAALGGADEVDLRLIVRPTAVFEQTPGPRAGQPLLR